MADDVTEVEKLRQEAEKIRQEAAQSESQLKKIKDEKVSSEGESDQEGIPGLTF